jgi:tRNA(adenine34) deaminase
VVSRVFLLSQEFAMSDTPPKATPAVAKSLPVEAWQTMQSGAEFANGWVLQDPAYQRHCGWMERAIALADAAGAAGEVPVGAVVVDGQDRVLAEAENRRQRDCDPTAHAEVLALRAAGQRRGNWHLNDCTLYVTLEPCPMCAGALVLARLGSVVYGADDPKAGAVRSVINIPDGDCSNHRISVLGGILEESCRAQLHAWFGDRRTQPPLPDP